MFYVGERLELQLQYLLMLAARFAQRVIYLAKL